MLEIEMANSARLISLNSSSGNYQLKTFLSATESVMVDELGESKDKLSDILCKKSVLLSFVFLISAVLPHFCIKTVFVFK